jgi:tryptophanase
MDSFLSSGSTFIKRKKVETTEELRSSILKNVEHSPFAYPAALLNMDLISDSGSCALNQHMWMAMALADESYARNNWYFALLDAFRDLIERGDNPRKLYLHILDSSLTAEKLTKDLYFPEIKGSFINDSLTQLVDPNAFIFAQGRCCETALFLALHDYFPKDNTKKLILSNGFFDTTKAHCEISGGFEAVELEDPTIYDDYDLNLVGKQNPFRGGIDLNETEKILMSRGDEVVMVLMTLTNNSRAAQPVSMKNLKSVKSLCDKYEKPLWIDVCRVNENAAFIKLYEEGYSNMSIQEILKEIFSLCDGFHISMKKVLCNMGGFMAIRPNSLFMKKFNQIGIKLKQIQILQYGNDSYGALSGRDLAAATIGLYECVDFSFLKSRLSATMYVGKQVAQKGVPVILPPGGHAIYLNINKMFSDRKWDEFVGCGLVSMMISKYGIRGCELGYQAWELDKYFDLYNKLPEKLPPNFVRFAFPANVYHKEHLDYLIESLIDVNNNKDKVSSVVITRGKDSPLRHFIVGFRLIDKKIREDNLIELKDFSIDE